MIKGLFLALIGVLLVVFLGCMFKGGIDDDWKFIGVYLLVMSFALIFLGGVVFGQVSAALV